MEMLDLINRLGSCIAVRYVLYIIADNERCIIYEAFFKMSKKWTLSQESSRPNFYPITFVLGTLVSSPLSESALKRLPPSVWLFM